MSRLELTGTGPAAGSAVAAPTAAGGAGLWVLPPAGLARPHQGVDHVSTTGTYPRVIDGEVTDSWLVRPILPILVSSAAMFALGLAALIQEAVR